MAIVQLLRGVSQMEALLQQLKDEQMAHPSDPRERLKEYAAEFSDLVRSGATKEQLRNGINGKHGINHLNEVFMMLPESPNKAEFRIRE